MPRQRFNRVRIITTLALATLPLTALLAAEPATVTSKPFRAAMHAAQVAAQTGDTGAFQARVGEAAMIARTPDERYYVGALRYRRAAQLSQPAEQRKALGEMLGSGSALASNTTELNRLAALSAYQAGDAQAAYRYFIEADRADMTDIDSLLAFADLQSRAKRPGMALALAQRAVTQRKAQGQKPPESWYDRGLSLAYAEKDPAQVAAWGRMLLADYPSAANYRLALMTYDAAAKHGSSASFDLHRLLVDGRALVGQRDILDFAELAIKNNAAAEAQGAISVGAVNAMVSVSEPAVVRQLKAASDAAKRDNAALTKGAASGASASDRAKAGQVALAKGDYARASTLLQGVAPGDPEAQTRLGIALARAGQKDQARAAFAAVTGPRAEIARFWTQWLDRPS